MIKDLFKDVYDAKRELSEINILRKLSSVKSNEFTTLIYDIIIPEINYQDTEPIKTIFIVMDNVSNDLNTIINDYN